MENISKDFKNTIKEIYSKLKDSGIEWYITGKTNLALQGVKIKPKCISLLIHDEDLDKVSDLFMDYKKSDVIELDNKEAKEFSMSVGGVDVIVCGEYNYGTYWQIFKDPVYLKTDDMRLPCFNLKVEKDAFVRLGMMKKEKAVDEFLKKKKKKSK
jgi:hypothetical protein